MVSKLLQNNHHDSKQSVQNDFQLMLSGALPGEGLVKGQTANATVTAFDSEHHKEMQLLTKLAEGGEGAIFTTNIQGFVAKIYKREKLTASRKAKIEIMVSRHINRPAICFPQAIVKNDRGEFVGYLMPQAKGIELARSVFQPKLLLKKFPDWDKRSTVQLCLTILEEIKFLNEKGIILGDINPMNILVVSPTEVYFVDCDSYQIEGYPCPVGTANFSAPEIQGAKFDTFLRTQAMENFAIATLMFMIMLPGKAPYSGVGGASPAENIKNGVFPYPHKETEANRTPPGSWGFIWSHMSYKIRLAFYETFRKGEAHFSPKDRYTAEEWIHNFNDYLNALNRHMANNDAMSLEIFPSREKKKRCKDCGELYIPDRNNYTPFCPKCNTRHNRRCILCGKPFQVSEFTLSWEKMQGSRTNRCPECRKRAKERKGDAKPATTCRTGISSPAQNKQRTAAAASIKPPNAIAQTPAKPAVPANNSKNINKPKAQTHSVSSASQTKITGFGATAQQQAAAVKPSQTAAQHTNASQPKIIGYGATEQQRTTTKTTTSPETSKSQEKKQRDWEKIRIGIALTFMISGVIPLFLSLPLQTPWLGLIACPVLTMTGFLILSFPGALFWILLVICGITTWLCVTYIPLQTLFNW